MPILFPTPLPTWTPHPAPIPEEELLKYCQAVNEYTSEGHWDAALQRAEEAEQRFPKDFVHVVQSIQSQCDFQPPVAQAGVELAQPHYDAGQYPQAEEAIQRAIALLDLLVPSETIADNREYRDLVILWQCALYKQHITNNNLGEAKAALVALEPYIDQTGFRNDFAQRCKQSYDELLAALEPTSTPRPTSPSRPTSTPSPSTSAPTCQPTLPDRLDVPAEDATHYAGQSKVLFRWEGGSLCGDQVWQVAIDGRIDLCPPTREHQVLCNMPTEVGEHGWSVGIREADGSVIQDTAIPVSA